MINFHKKLPDFKIKNELGELVDVRKLPAKSVRTEETAEEFLNSNNFLGLYMGILNDEILLKAFLKYMEQFSDLCIKESERSEHWDCTYDTAIIYSLHEFLKRYKELFDKYGIEATYSNCYAIQTFYEKAIESACILADDIPPEDFSKVKDYTAEVTIRGNTAGFRMLIQHYSAAQFLNHLEYFISQINVRLNKEKLILTSLLDELIKRIKEKDI